jgi:hypothetical protein
MDVDGSADFGGYAYANAMLDGNLEKKQAWKSWGPPLDWAERVKARRTDKRDRKTREPDHSTSGPLEVRARCT